jgi:hypothetical protein
LERRRKNLAPRGGDLRKHTRNRIAFLFVIDETYQIYKLWSEKSEYFEFFISTLMSLHCGHWASYNIFQRCFVLHKGSFHIFYSRLLLLHVVSSAEWPNDIVALVLDKCFFTLFWDDLVFSDSELHLFFFITHSNVTELAWCNL